MAAGGEVSQRMESLERYRDKKRRRLFSGAKTIRYEKRKVNADRRSVALHDDLPRTHILLPCVDSQPWQAAAHAGSRSAASHAQL